MTCSFRIASAAAVPFGDSKGIVISADVQNLALLNPHIRLHELNGRTVVLCRKKF